MASWSSVSALAQRAERDPTAPPQRGATQEELGSLERRLDTTLPEPLVRWLTILNGDTIGQGGVFGAREDDAALDIARIRSIFREEWQGTAWLPVASDGCGNYYVLMEDGRVGFVETSEDPRLVSTIEAESLDEFLLWYLPRK